MAKLKVHAGDFTTGKNSQFLNGVFLMDTGKRGFFGVKWERIPATELAEVEEASEESVKRLGGTVGWGLAGAALLGPVGLLAGLLAGGRGKDVTFAATFKDGRRLLASAPAKAFTAMRAKVF